MSKPGRWIGSGAATLLAAAIFAIDMITASRGSIAVLYIFVLILAGNSPKQIRDWALLCILMTFVPFGVWHSAGLDADSASRLFVAIAAIITTAILLDSRWHLRQAPAGLERRVRELRAFADSVPPLLWTTRADGYCDFINQRFEDMTGMSVSEAICEQSWSKTVHPDDEPGFLKTWTEALKTGKEYCTIFRLRHRDGQYRWMQSIGRPVRSPSGEVLRWYGGLSDVDAEVRAQETIKKLNAALARKVEERTGELARAQWRYRNLFEDKNIAVAECDFREAKPLLEELKAQGVTDLAAYAAAHPDFLAACLARTKTVDCNDTLLAMLGYASREELASIPPAETVVDGPDVMWGLLDALFQERSSVSGTAVLIGANGRRVPVMFATNLSPDGTSYSTVFDISEREKAHALVLAAQQELARANRAATLGALSVSLAHELNQPISSMAIDIDICLRSLEGEAPERVAQRQILERIHRNTQRLSEIVERTRDKISRQRRKMMPVELCDIADEARSLLEHEIAARRAVLLLKCERPLPVILADRVELQQVFINLIVNALDAMMHVPEDRRVVELWVRQSGANQVLVSVSDSGPGIAEDDMEKLFQPFFTTKAGGIGMGLQICRSCIEALGGELNARNRPEGGAVFEFALPSTADAVTAPALRAAG